MLRGLYSSGLVLAVPKKLEYAMKNEIARLEEAHQVVHLNTIERIGRREGRKEGRKQGRREGRKEGIAEGLRGSILQVIEVRWSLSEPWICKVLQGVHDEERLSTLLKQAVSAVDSEQWKASLAGSDLSWQPGK